MIFDKCKPRPRATSRILDVGGFYFTMIILMPRARAAQPRSSRTDYELSQQNTAESQVIDILMLIEITEKLHDCHAVAADDA